MADQVDVRYRFTLFDSKGNTFSSALYYDYNAYPTIKQSAIDADKQSHLATWNTAISTPPPLIDLDKAILDCQTQIDYYTKLKADYTTQKGGQ